MVGPIAGEMHLDPEKVSIRIAFDAERRRLGAQLAATNRTPVRRAKLKGNPVSAR